MQNLPPSLPQQNRLISLFSHIFAFTGKQNTITSPLSIYSCLAMLAEGSSGQSFQELASLLGYESESQVYDQHSAKALAQLHGGENKAVVIKMSNLLYVNQKYPLNPSYVQAVVQKHWGSAENVDFEDPTIKDRINGKIADLTNGLIKNCISDVPAATQAILVNTIYFKGTWADQFSKDNTHKSSFYKQTGDSVEVDFMTKEVRAGLFQSSTSRYLALPYKGNELMLVIELPLDRNLAQVDTESVLNAASVSQSKVEVYLPKFKFEFKCDELLELLKKLGVIAVTEGRGLEKMSQHPCKLDKVIHQAFIQVDEEGTEAAAATVAMMRLTCIMNPVPTPQFRADSPFFFHIVDSSSQTILFSGAIQVPKF